MLPHINLFLTIITALSAAVLNACSDKDSVDDTTTINEEFSIQMTTPVPGAYFAEADQKGTIELLEYDSKDYTQSSQPATRKPAYVYLPYGYDPSQKYDIIYLLHGWTGVAEEYFLGRNGNSRTAMVNMFDNMIQHGLCKPFIAVSPTWDKDNRPKDWSESCREAAVFAQEYVNDLIPAVESHYSTYATTTDEAGILASRGHRALGGFSLGSITTWYVFEQAFPYSRWYLPMSGDNWSQGMFGGQYYPEATARFLADLVNASPYGNDFYVWYAVGTNDVRKPQTHNQAMAKYHEADIRTFLKDAFGLDDSLEAMEHGLVRLFTELGVGMHFSGEATIEQIRDIDINTSLTREEVLEVIKNCLN